MIKFIFLISIFTLNTYAKTNIQLWHQMIYSHREVLSGLVKDFENQNPEIKVQVTYRETEELRSAFQSSSMAGSGPELIYGPSDQVGPFAEMGLIRPLDSVLGEDYLAQFDQLAKVKYKKNVYMLGGSVGNFLMIIYNKKLLKSVPDNLNDFIKTAKNLTLDTNEDGKIDQYGLVFNFTEPYFFIPWVDGYGEHFMKNGSDPNLNSPSMEKAFKLMQNFRDREKIIPKECDYEMANSLFKEGKAAMIINGDWSWGDYKNAGIEFGIAKFPLIDETGKRPAPLVGTTGYSLNSKIKSAQKLEASILLIKYLNSKMGQTRFTEKLLIYPSRLDIRKEKIITENIILKDAAEIMATGNPMPVVPEVRAVWDSLRSQYQSVLAGTTSPDEAATQAQLTSLKQISNMNEILKKDWTLYLVYLFFLLVILFVFFKVSKNVPSLFKEMKNGDFFPYLMLLPAAFIIFIVIIFPFFYNVALSFSNFSLKTFTDWHLVGLHHYIDVLKDSNFYKIFLKTLIWTFSNVFFHVSIGIVLAVLIEQVMPKKKLWRTILIIPWAIPQYITALTWRGLFNQEYGPINIFLQDYLKLSPVQWLTQPWTTFSACIITNVWLGFPFMMIVALGGLQSVPPDLYESAKIDGANAWLRFKHITLPMLKPVMMPAALLGLIWTFNTLNVIWLVSNSGEPADQTHILVSYVYKAAFNLYRYGYAAALSIIIFIILLVMNFMVNKISSKRESL